jgi:hypothetical protein
VEEVQPIGWSGTRLPTPTAAAYRDVLEELAAALVLRRVAEQPADGKAKSRNLLPCVCSCERRIRVARRTLDDGPILCGRCEKPFVPADEDANVDA